MINSTFFPKKNQSLFVLGQQKAILIANNNNFRRYRPLYARFIQFYDFILGFDVIIEWVGCVGGHCIWYRHCRKSNAHKSHLKSIFYMRLSCRYFDIMRARVYELNDEIMLKGEFPYQSVTIVVLSFSTAILFFSSSAFHPNRFSCELFFFLAAAQNLLFHLQMFIFSSRKFLFVWLFRRTHEPINSKHFQTGHLSASDNYEYIDFFSAFVEYTINNTWKIWL